MGYKMVTGQFHRTLPKSAQGIYSLPFKYELSQLTTKLMGVLVNMEMSFQIYHTFLILICIINRNKKFRSLKYNFIFTFN